MSDSIEAGERPAEIDRDEAAFEAGESTRASRREEKSINRLLRQRAADRAENDALKRRLAELEAAQHKGRLANLDGDIDAAERDAGQAIAEGDAERAAKAQRRMAELAAKRTAAEYDAPRPAASGPPAEVADWMERNAWFNPAKADPKTKLALIAHSEAVDVEGLTPNTPEYFRHIERRVETKFPGTVAADDVDDDAEPPARPQRRAASGPAPVNARAGTPRPASSPSRIKLTAEQVDLAKSLGITPEAYAASQVALAAAGDLGGRR
jgi:hypothetical protein